MSKSEPSDTLPPDNSCLSIDQTFTDNTKSPVDDSIPQFNDPVESTNDPLGLDFSVDSVFLLQGYNPNELSFEDILSSDLSLPEGVDGFGWVSLEYSPKNAQCIKQRESQNIDK